MTFIWNGLLLAWFVVLCLVPDPRPIGASELAVNGVRLLVGVSEPAWNPTGKEMSPVRA
ncbi:MAG: hypothetical protein GY937_25285 [bacterium]|nr:hypothetical protein [bacterium]